MTNKTGNFFSKKPNNNHTQSAERIMNQDEKSETGTTNPEAENLSVAQEEQTEEINSSQESKDEDDPENYTREYEEDKEETNKSVISIEINV